MIKDNGKFCTMHERRHNVVQVQFKRDIYVTNVIQSELRIHTKINIMNLTSMTFVCLSIDIIYPKKSKILLYNLVHIPYNSPELIYVISQSLAVDKSVCQGPG